MKRQARSAALLLATASLPTLAHAQTAPTRPAAPQSGGSTSLNEEEGEEIVVTGQRERGAVIGDIKPEQQLNAADVRALGVSNISELLTELGPQLQSSSGKPPVTLLEGHRISSFREIASLPAEAIQRVDILPEEVGLRYGYAADQKVMNIVLRQRFRAFNAEVGGRVPTAGDGATATAQGGFLGIRRGTRINLSADYSKTGRILESDRGLTAPDSAARTLSGEREQLTVNGSYNRPIGERTQATINGEIGTSRSESNVGLSLPAVTIPGGSPYASGPADSLFYPAAPGIGALQRSSSTQTGLLGLTVNAERSSGQWTLTATYNRSDSTGITWRPFNLSTYAAAVAAGVPGANPALPVAQAYLIPRASDLTQSRSDTAEVDFVHNRSLFALPAGDVSATLKLGGELLRQESNQERDLVPSARNISRDSGSGSLSLDFPFASASSAIGRLSANANAGIEQYSDAGTLRTFGGGLNWTPKRGISLSASYRDEENAPTPSQLGGPATFTQFVPVFDYVRGESVLVTTISGGNAALRAARDQNIRLGLVLTPLQQDPNLVISLDYNHRRQTGGIMNFPGITQATALAFPDRFVRNASGILTQVDLRPINISEQTRDSLRWGINFSKRLKTPQSEIDAMRAAFQRRFPNGVPGGPGGQRGPGAGQERTQGAQPSGGAASAAPPAGEGQAPAAAPPGNFALGGPGGGGAGGGGRGGGPGGGRGGGGGFGGGQGGGGGRINFAIYHEWSFANKTQLSPMLPVLDLLNGDSLGGGAGPSRHEIELQAGISQSGYGLRLMGDWKSATRINGVAGVPSSQLRFGDLATLNLRLFANLTQMPSLVEKVPLLRGVRVQVGVDNIFNTRQRVTDGTGAVPFAYQPAFVDPVGRVVRLSIRKLFF